MTLLLRTTLIALSACLSLGSAPALADHDRHENNAASQLLLGLASSVLLGDAANHHIQDKPRRSHSRRDYGRSVERGFDRSRAKPAKQFRQGHSDGRRVGASYTSQPIRGGSSRRTRIIENPYPSRAITGISFNGIERNAVHINDVITYPRKRKISRQGYSLSLFHPSPFLGARGYVDYISVKAKRREHFTVTFHYE